MEMSHLAPLSTMYSVGIGMSKRKVASRRVSSPDLSEVIIMAQLYYGGCHVPPRGKIKTDAEVRQLESSGSYPIRPEAYGPRDPPPLSPSSQACSEQTVQVPPKLKSRQGGTCPIFSVGFLLVKLNSS